MANTTLSAAKVAKKDEFYTQLPDIENELCNYEAHFKDKVVLCNCDDPRVSNFVRYFMLKFKKLGLKRLIATCYKNQNIDLFSQHDSERAIYMVYEGEQDGNMPDWDKIETHELNGDGDFRSNECIELLKQADIVVTNPPFSLFREYITQLVRYKKKFLIIGNTNAIQCKEVWPLIKNNEVWLGVSSFNTGMYFGVPDDFEYASTYKFDRERNGIKVSRVSSVCWYTNLEHSKRHKPLPLYKHYTPEEYKKYDNYDAIDVSKVSDIPVDYDGVMGVPITFIDKYCPEQFELIWRGGDIEWAEKECTFFTPPSKERSDRFKKEDRTWRVQNVYFVDKDDHVQTIYQRLFIKHIKK